MGLLDALFDPNSYGGQNGGILDLIRNSQMQQSQYQPSAGFLPAASNPSPAALPQGPANVASDDEDEPAPAGPFRNMQIGNYQMPQFGTAADYNPATIPTNAQSAQGQLPAPAQSPAAQSPDILGHIGAALQSIGAPNSLFHNIVTNPLTALVTGQTPTSALQQQQAQIANLTGKALLAKGVPLDQVQAAIQPGNTEMLKTLITQAFGPQTVTSLGSGYVADKSGKITRAFEPEDKIPSGFAKDDNGQMSYIPGGPADPAYQRLVAAKAADPNAVFVLGKGGELYKKDAQGNVTIVHKNEAEQPEANLSDETVKSMASQYLAGDKTVKQNIGRGAQGSANLVKLNNEIYTQANAAGLDGKAIVNNFNEQAGNLAGQRSIGTRSANISLAANEANNMIPIALDASAKVPRGEWMPWNKMVQAYQTGTSSPELARFVAATNSLVNSYVRAVSPSGVPTDSMREHAYSMLNSAQSPRAYEAVTSIMQDEMKAAMAAPGQVRKELRNEGPAAETEPKAPAVDQVAIEAEMKRRGLLK